MLCPYFSSIASADNKPNAIVSNLLDIADKIRAVAIIDGTNTTKSDTIAFASNIGSSRAYIIDPAYKPNFKLQEQATTTSSSPLVAGVIAKNDNTKGFWWSPSNTEVKGVLGTSRPIDFSITDATCEANLLNEVGVSTIVFSGGVYKIWGNRSPSKDNKWNFLSVRRTVDAVYDAIEANMLWAMDRPFSKNLFDSITN